MGRHRPFGFYHMERDMTERDTAAKCNCSLPVLGYFDITTHTVWGVGRNGHIYRILLAKIEGEQP
jgi:hypothetical protein